MTHFLRRFAIMMIIISVNAVADDSAPARRHFKEFMQDTAISAKVKYQLTRDKLVKKRNMNVDVHRGVVTITGFALSEGEKERVSELAGRVKGVGRVDNFLKIFNAGSLAEESADLKPQGHFNSAVGEKPVDEPAPIQEMDLTTLPETSTVDSTKLFPWTGESVAPEEESTPLMHTRVDGSKVEAASPAVPSASSSSASSSETDSLAQQAAEELKKLRKK